MRISADMLRRGLFEQGVKVDAYGDVGGTLDLSLVLYAQEGERIEDGIVYLTDRPGAFKAGRRKARSVCVIAGNYDASFARRFESVFVAEEGVTAIELHNKVQRVFGKYDLWSGELRRLLNTGSNVQGMLDVGTQAMENPLILQDSNFSVIAVSAAYAGDPSLEPVLDPGMIPYLMMSERGARIDTAESGAVVPLQITGRHALYTNIFQQGRFQYRLLALEMDREFHASARSLLEFLSGYIQLAIGFVVDDGSESSALAFILKGILSGENRDEEYAEQRMAEYGWSPGHALICAKIRAELPDYRNRTMRFMSDRLSMIFPEACIFEYENSIAAFFNLSIAAGPGGREEAPNEGAAKNDGRAALDSPAGVLESLAGFLQDNNMKAGVSNRFYGFGYIRQYFTQASVAIELGPRLKPYQWLHLFSNVKESYIIGRCTEELPATMICDPGLLRLRAYDEQHRQDLYHTLYIYLKNNMRAVSAAKELFIHRSTFLYRLDRIREITGLTLENDSELWYLLLSYKLLEQGQERP